MYNMSLLLINITKNLIEIASFNNHFIYLESVKNVFANPRSISESLDLSSRNIWRDDDFVFKSTTLRKLLGKTDTQKRNQSNKNVYNK